METHSSPRDCSLVQTWSMIFVYFTEKPLLVNTSSTNPPTVIVGDSISLSVSYTNNDLGLPQNVTWRGPQGPISSSAGQLQLSDDLLNLTIHGAQVGDSGNYTVSVVNNAGTSELTFVVLVRERGKIEL